MCEDASRRTENDRITLRVCGARVWLNGKQESFISDIAVSYFRSADILGTALQVPSLYDARE